MGNDQLAELAGILDSTDIPWWISCGTLLGIVRDGTLIESDIDIDVECWAQPTGWAELESALSQSGYVVTTRSFAGMVYKYWLRHPDWPRVVDFHILREHAGMAWYPAKLKLDSEYERGSVKWFLAGGLRWPLRWLWTNTELLDDTPRIWLLMRYLRLPMNSMQVPAHFYERIERRQLAGLELPVPAKAEAFLEYRYGDWRTPVSDWDFRRDDPAYRWAPPPRVEATPPLRDRS